MYWLKILFKNLFYRKNKSTFDSCVVCYSAIKKGECFCSIKCEEEALENLGVIDYKVNWK